MFRGARQRPRLRTCLHVSGEGDEHTRSTDLSWVAIQNGCAERLIGTLRRECLDRVVIFSEMHLRRILSAYAAFYNQARTLLALRKMRPCIEQSNALAPSSPFRSWLDCTTSTSGYDFRKGQGSYKASRRRRACYIRLEGSDLWGLARSGRWWVEA